MQVSTLNITEFKPIELQEMEKASFMNRTDEKFWFHSKHLPEIIQSVYNDYYILSIEGQNKFPYATTYYDTADDEMYIMHHNGKLKRIKIRKREYVFSGLSFLEIKEKNNKGKTLKRRIERSVPNSNGFTIRESELINATTPFDTSSLKSTLKNSFTRITLVNKNFSERCTIDYDLSFTAKNVNRSLDSIAIIEIKSDKFNKQSPLKKALNDLKIRSSGFSKYCIGRVLTDPELKNNSFKKKVRRIEKEINESLLS